MELDFGLCCIVDDAEPDSVASDVQAVHQLPQKLIDDAPGCIILCY